MLLDWNLTGGSWSRTTLTRTLSDAQQGMMGSWEEGRQASRGDEMSNGLPLTSQEKKRDNSAL